MMNTQSIPAIVRGNDATVTFTAYSLTGEEKYKDFNPAEWEITATLTSAIAGDSAIELTIDSDGTMRFFLDGKTQKCGVYGLELVMVKDGEIDGRINVHNLFKITEANVCAGLPNDNVVKKDIEIKIDRTT